MADHTNGNGFKALNNMQNAQGCSVRPIKGIKELNAQLHNKVRVPFVNIFE
jgi:hypothetical protein